ncbi:type II toxin-antitoxin system RelE/ParE family toxin, partial [Streptomyces sp. MCAF7]
MSEYRTVFRPEAQAELRKVPRDIALRILAKLTELGDIALRILAKLTEL